MAKGSCKNCGDATTWPSHGVGEREKMEWCVPCYQIWDRAGRPSFRDEDYDRKEPLAQEGREKSRRYYDSR
jgi:hypothetical protein